MTNKTMRHTAATALAIALSMAGCATTTIPPSHPAELLGGLARWHLTLPTSKDKQAFPADQIDQPELATFSNEYFKLNETRSAVVFTSMVGGATTSAGTAFSRSELRERDVQGEKSAWNCAQDERVMTIRQRILKTPTHKPEMSVGQIHDAKSDNLEVFYKGPVSGADGVGDQGVMLAKFNGESSTKAPVLDDAYRVGDMMQVKVSTKAGVITVDYRNERSGKTSTASKPFDKISGGCYFKAGNYPQACTKVNVYGVTNPNCSKKTYAPEVFETDPNATSVLEIYSLTLN
jgi:hypothetical protein